MIHLLLVCFKKKMQQSKIAASSTQVLGPAGPEPEFYMSKDKLNFRARQLTLPITLKGQLDFAKRAALTSPSVATGPRARSSYGPLKDPLQTPLEAKIGVNRAKIGVKGGS